MFCESQEDAEHTIEILQEWLAERGLVLSEDKTRIVHIAQGFDFLGFTIRLLKQPRTRTGYRLRVTPSKAAECEMRQHLKEEWTRLAGCDVAAIVGRLNPLIRGWATYFRIGRCSPTFDRLDHWMHHREKWYARKRHPSKPSGWRRRRYWGRLKPGSADRWVFGDTRTRVYLLKFGWFTLHKHTLVRGTASPDDPRLKDYWAARKAAQAHTLTPSRRKLAAAQGFVCRVCGEALLNGEELHEHHIQPRRQGGDSRYANLALVHLYCHQQIHGSNPDATRAPVHEPARRWLRPWLA